MLVLPTLASNISRDLIYVKSLLGGCFCYLSRKSKKIFMTLAKLFDKLFLNCSASCNNSCLELIARQSLTFLNNGRILIVRPDSYVEQQLTFSFQPVNNYA